MPSSLSSHIDNLTEGLHNDKCTDCKSYLKYMSTKDNQLMFKCLKCNKNYKKEPNKDLIKRFKNTDKFCNKHVIYFVIKERCLSIRLYG